MAALIKDTITYYRSTSFSFEVAVTPPDGLTATNAYFTVKTDKFSSDVSDTDAILKKDLALSSNAGTITIAPNDIADSVEPATMFYSIHIKLSDGSIYPFASGKFKLVATTTNRES